MSSRKERIERSDTSVASGFSTSSAGSVLHHRFDDPKPMPEPAPEAKPQPKPEPMRDLAAQSDLFKTHLGGQEVLQDPPTVVSLLRDSLALAKEAQVQAQQDREEARRYREEVRSFRELSLQNLGTWNQNQVKAVTALTANEQQTKPDRPRDELEASRETGVTIIVIAICFLVMGTLSAAWTEAQCDISRDLLWSGIILINSALFLGIVLTYADDTPGGPAQRCFRKLFIGLGYASLLASALMFVMVTFLLEKTGFSIKLAVVCGGLNAGICVFFRGLP